MSVVFCSDRNLHCDCRHHDSWTLDSCGSHCERRTSFSILAHSSLLFSGNDVGRQSALGGNSHTYFRLAVCQHHESWALDIRHSTAAGPVSYHPTESQLVADIHWLFTSYVEMPLSLLAWNDRVRAGCGKNCTIYYLFFGGGKKSCVGTCRYALLIYKSSRESG